MDKFIKNPDKESEIIHKRWNYNISKVYVVCVLNYIMDSSRPDKYRWDIVRMDRELSISVERDLLAALDTSFEDGMEKGEVKGKAEGKAEEQRLIATNFKKQGINIETIAQCTGLSVEEIGKL